MTACPPRDRLEAFLEDHLDGTERDAVSVHVDACRACQAALEGLTAAPEELRPTLTAARRPADTEAASSSFFGLLRQSAGQAPRGPVEAPIIAGYEVLEEIGRGGMGVVYRARQVSLNRIVALKMVLAGAHAAPKDLARFGREAEAVAQLHHPNIVQVFEVGTADGRPYFAMELVAGGSLVQHLQGRLPPPRQSARLIETLARTVHFAHECGIVHRDLKPANILLASGACERPVAAQTGVTQDPPLALGTPKITDFGLAKRLDGHAAATLTGEVIGTPSYMAPEQAGSKNKGKAQTVGPAADTYALGAILYELLTGQPPFKAATALETVIQVLHSEPVRPTRLQPGTPRDLETVCLKCLEKDPARRYADAEELADDLRRFRRGDPVLARPVRLPERAVKWARRRPFTALLLAGMVLVGLLGFSGVTWQWRVAVAEKAEKVKEKVEADKARNQALAEKTEKEHEMRQAVAARKQANAALYHSRISQSQLHWRLNDFTGALRTLRDCRPEPRGWEWHYLHGLYATELLTLSHGHRSPGGAVAVHPQRRWIASVVAGQDAVRIWNEPSGALLFSLPAAGADRLAFRPDGSRLAVADRNGWVTVWDLAGRLVVSRHRPHTQPISGLAYSPNNRWLATASHDGTVRVWDTRTATERHAFAGHAERANAVAFAPDGNSLATADQRGTLRIWNVDKGGPPHILPGHKSAVYSLAYSPNGKLLVSAGSNGTLRIWEIMEDARPRVVQSLTGNAGAVLSVAFSPDARFLAYGGSDATVRVCHRATGVERMIFRGHAAAIECVCFSPDGRRLVSCCPGEGNVKVWDLTRHPEYATLARTHHPEYPDTARAGLWSEVKVWDLLRGQAGPRQAHTGPDVEALAFQDGGRRLVSVTVGGRVQTWEADSGLLLAERCLRLGADLISPAVLADFSPDGSRLAARATLSGPLKEKRPVVQLWDVRTRRELATLRGHRLPVFLVRFSPDGRRLATVGCDRSTPGRSHEILVWDVETGQRLARHSGLGHLFNLTFSPDSRWLATGGEGGSVRVLDWASGTTVLGGAWHKGAVTALAFRGGRRRPLLLATAGAEDRTLQVRDCGSGQVRDPQQVPGLLCDLVFSPDGQRLAGICRDRVKLWDAETGQELLTLHGAPPRHRDPAFNPRLVFSPDGKRLAGTNWDESISVWEAEEPGARRQEARRLAAERRAPLWHLEEAERCARFDNASAAAFHLRWVREEALPARLRERKDHLVQQLSLRP